MQLDDLALLFALEPAWTLCINGREFVELRTRDIEMDGATLRCPRLRRTILDVTWLRPNVVRIRAQARMRAQPDILLFHPPGQVSFGFEARRRRTLFQQALAPALEHYFKVTVHKQTLHSDKQHGVGGAYPRFFAGTRAVIAVDPDEPSAVINGIMRAAIQWSSQMPHNIAVVVPSGRKDTVSGRLSALPRLARKFEWLEWDGERVGPLKRTRPAVDTHVHDYEKPQVDAEVARLCNLAPNLLQAVPNIPLKAISIRLRGLEVAQVCEHGTSYPLGEPLEPLIEKLALERSYGSRHPLARTHEESWLESLLVTHVEELLPLKRGFLYPQVPSFAGPGGADRRVIDMLSITEEGRLVVIEIKAASDPELPFQALDYWLAVERHRVANDFAARGYFPGIAIANQPAVLVMVAPLLVFHKTFDRMTSFFPQTLPILQIGINQGWKKQIKILRRRSSLR